MCGHFLVTPILGLDDPLALEAVQVLHAEIEFKVHQAIDRAEKGQPTESSFVELKAKWCDAADDEAVWKWARQIAAMGNAARGDPFLWVVGVKQKVGVFEDGANDEEWSNIRAQIERKFDGKAPVPTEALVARGDKTVVGIQFESDYAPPYVVKRKINRDTDIYEVFWRDATGTRHARHEDLIKMLVPAARMPSVKVLSGELTFIYDGNKQLFRPRADLILFISPPIGQFATFLYSDMSASLKMSYRYDPSPNDVKFELIRARRGSQLSKYVEGTGYEITAENPGALELQLWTEIEHITDPPQQFEGFEVNLILKPVFSSKVIPIDLVCLGRELSGDEKRYSCELLDKPSTREQP